VGTELGNGTDPSLLRKDTLSKLQEQTVDDMSVTLASDEEDQEVMKNVEEILRNKLGIDDILEVEINSGYKKNMFSELFSV